MSHAPTRKTTARQTTFVGLPTGSGIAVIAAALFTGAALSIYDETIGWPFFTLFSLATIIVTASVNPRGLYLVVASAPILYILGLLGAGWFTPRPQGTAESGVASRAVLLSIGYPVVEFFPVLAAVTVGSVALALLRIGLLKRHNEIAQRNAATQRVRQAESNRRTTHQNRRARERSTTVTVQELLQRRAQSEELRRPAQPETGGGRGSTRTRRSLSDDLYQE
ncbi:DUF6542 domain-containing protein [Corynebacterium mayonis]|uniref:DUF6542 domain-containing protein n=1 Tax=Corynebacterium mayonis TaxID=3062461 RepID=UPI0031404E04